MKRQNVLIVTGVLSAAYMIWMVLGGASVNTLLVEAAFLGVMLAAMAEKPQLSLICAGVNFLLEVYWLLTMLPMVVSYGFDASLILSVATGSLPMLLISGLWVYDQVQGRPVSATVFYIAIAAAVFFFMRQIVLMAGAGFRLGLLNSLVSIVRSVLPYAAYAIGACYNR
ncbi:MAG: hypothetical protein IKK75_09170 [Clostridia bacterium]|nr:hypothetical protein [Clostridia bacterium]